MAVLAAVVRVGWVKILVPVMVDEMVLVLVLVLVSGTTARQADGKNSAASS